LIRADQPRDSPRRFRRVRYGYGRGREFIADVICQATRGVADLAKTAAHISDTGPVHGRAQNGFVAMLVERARPGPV